MIDLLTTLRPRRENFSKHSWARIEPLQKGRRIEIHLGAGEDMEALEGKLIKLMRGL